MKNTKTFQYVVIGIFVFFIIVGAILFATYRSSQSAANSISINMWGTLSADAFSSFTTQYFSDQDLKYTVNYTQRDPSTFDRDLVEALASGSGPDAIILPESLIYRYFNRIYPIPYTLLPELTFKQTYVQEGEMFLTANGILALPFSINPMVMYWNRDIFNNVALTKPPTNWADFITLAPKVVKKDEAQNITRSFTALGEYRNVNNAKGILSTLFLQTGNPIIYFKYNDSTFSSVLDQGENKANNLALQFYTNFSNPTRPEYSWNRSWPNSLDAFTNGDLAIYFGFASELPDIKSKNPNLNFDVSIMPQAKDPKAVYSTFGNMLGLAIMKNSSNPSGTYTVISALTSASAVPFWSKLFYLPSARRDILGILETNAARAVFNQSAIISRGWYDPKSADSNTVFQEMIESYTTGRDTLDGALNVASDRLENLLKK